MRLEMSSDKEKTFSKENIDEYLNELSKIYKKLVGRKFPAEIILIGGAAIIERYGFREITTDIDAIIYAASAMKQAINEICDKYQLPSDWLNADFKKTASYSEKLIQYSDYYKTFNQILTVRIVKPDYLIAMKLCSGRRYKHDLSDIVGILSEHKKNNNPITYEMIDNAIKELYGSWDAVSEHAKGLLEDALHSNDYTKLYAEVDGNEKFIKEQLQEYREKHPEETKHKKANEIIDIILETYKKGK